MRKEGRKCIKCTNACKKQKQCSSIYFFQIGFIKSPRVSEIMSSTSPPDQTLSLGCEITDFYPPNISVTWLKLREGEQDDREEEVIEGGELWGPIQTQPRLYRATASLRRRATNQEKRERGGFICRVEHSSLLEPIEKHWRNVDIGKNHFLPSTTSYNILTNRKKTIRIHFFIHLHFLFVLPQWLPPFLHPSRCVGAVKESVCSLSC